MSYSSLCSATPVSPSPQTNFNDEPDDEDHIADRPEALQSGSGDEMISVKAGSIGGTLRIVPQGSQLLILVCPLRRSLKTTRSIIFPTAHGAENAWRARRQRRLTRGM